MISYLGTLKIDGTGERIKLGGVPVIQPGFEYIINIIDESQEAEIYFRQRYPEIQNEIVNNMMRVNL